MSPASRPGLLYTLVFPNTLFHFRGRCILSYSFLKAAIWHKRMAGLGGASGVCVLSGDGISGRLGPGCSCTGGMARLYWYLAYWIGASHGARSGLMDGRCLDLSDVLG